jgi:hypothetical protein
MRVSWTLNSLIGCHINKTVDLAGSLNEEVSSDEREVSFP